MTVAIDPTSAGAASHEFDQALRRAQAEFLEMPGLQLTGSGSTALVFRLGALHGRAHPARRITLPHPHAQFVVRTRVI